MRAYFISLRLLLDNSIEFPVLFYFKFITTVYINDLFRHILVDVTVGVDCRYTHIVILYILYETNRDKKSGQVSRQSIPIITYKGDTTRLNYDLQMPSWP